MARNKKGVWYFTDKEVDKLAEELLQWMKDNPKEWQIEKFSTMKLIPYHYFTEELPSRSLLFKEYMSLCEDMKRIRFTEQVKNKEIPQTFGIFGAKNELGYRDRIESSDKKNAKREQPTKDGVKSAIGKAKEKYFSRPD